MSEVIYNMPTDGNSNPIQALPLQTPAEIDGSLASVQSAALTGRLVRIFAVSAVSADGTIRFLTGANPTALLTSHPVVAGGEIWVPIKSGDKVAIIGGVANVAVAGEVV